GRPLRVRQAISRPLPSDPTSCADAPVSVDPFSFSLFSLGRARSILPHRPEIACRLVAEGTMSRIALAAAFSGLLVSSVLFQPDLASQTQTPARTPEFLKQRAEDFRK